MRILTALLLWTLAVHSGIAATVTASWDAPSTNINGSPAVVDGYRLSYTCQSKAGTTPATAQQTSLTLDLPDGESCSASVVAYNAGGESQPSNTVRFNTPPLERPGAVRNLIITWKKTEHKPAMPIGTDVLFSDNFDRPDGPLDLPMATAGPAGNVWGIRSNRLSLTTAVISGWKAVIFTEPLTTNADIKATLQQDGGKQGVLFRATNNGTTFTGYVLGRDGGGVRIWRVINGVESTLLSQFVGVAWNNGTITVECETNDDGNVVLRVRSTVNGTVYSYTDTSPDRILAAGSSGVATGSTTSNAVWFDNLTFIGTDTGGGDEDAPILTDPDVTPTNAGNSADVSVTTDEGNGTLRLVVTDSATAPSAGQIKAGQDHTGAAALRAREKVVTAAGVQTFSLAVPFGTERYFHLLHTDAADNDSAVATAGPMDTAYQQVFFDDFNRPDGGLGSNWTNVYGAPAIVGNRVQIGTLDADDYSGALVNATAIATLAKQYAVELDTSAVLDPLQEDGVAVPFGAAEGDTFAGFMLFFGGDYVALWWWDDVASTYTQLDSSALTPEQAAGSYRVGIDHNGAVDFRVYSLVDDALLMDATVPGEDIPPYLTQVSPGAGFRDTNNSGTLWIDNYGVYAAPPVITYTAAAPLFFGTNF